MDLENTDKVNAIISLANRAHTETVRYRDHVWKTVVWTVALLVAILTAARTGPELWSIPCVKWPLCVVAVFIAAFGIWDVTFDYLEFVRNRNWQRKCERLLKFFEKNTYLDNDSLLREEWKEQDYRFRDCLLHYLQWLFIIVIVAGYVIVAILLLTPPGTD